MRLPDWKPRLTAYLTASMRRKFAYGVHDCALFAAGAVEAMTGVDHAAEWRGYRSRSEGMRALRADGYADHLALVADRFTEVPVAFAQPGDLAEVVGDDGRALGVVQGEAIYVLRPDGMGLVPLTSGVRAFRV